MKGYKHPEPHLSGWLKRSFLPWSRGGGWLGEAGTEVFYPKRLLPAHWEDPQIWWGQRVICPVTPEGFKWPPQRQQLSFFEHLPSVKFLTYTMSHPHNNSASRCHSPYFVKEEQKFREVKQCAQGHTAKMSGQLPSSQAASPIPWSH